MERIARTIYGPDKDWLTADESADWLNIPTVAFLRMVKVGKIPAGRSFSRKVRRWNWKTLWVVSYLVEIGHLECE